MLDFLREIYERREPADPTGWHKRNLFWPVRTIEGTIAASVWRRWQNGRWEYSEREETLRDMLDRAL